jgi:hypothetical protein
MKCIHAPGVASDDSALDGVLDGIDQSLHFKEFARRYRWAPQ